MKKVLSIVTISAAIAIVMVSCKGRSVNMPATIQDTTGLAEFKQWQAWKAQNEAPAPVAPAPQKVVVVRKVASTSGSMNSSTTNEAKTVKKKGWSKAAKGTVIGTAGGAVLGAVINKKNRVAGGIIGGILGCGLGYGIGRSEDRKDGRVVNN
jgi:hypothetical protein